MIKVRRYNKILDNITDFVIPDVTTSIPTPNESDYKRGYVIRYFIQRVNDNNSYIYEVDEKFYNMNQSNFYFRSVSLDWKIKGDESDVKKSNLKSINLASKNMKSIGLYLPNLLQFYKK